jgi:hypothetical protein
MLSLELAGVHYVGGLLTGRDEASVDAVVTHFARLCPEYAEKMKAVPPELIAKALSVWNHKPGPKKAAQYEAAARIVRKLLNVQCSPRALKVNWCDAMKDHSLQVRVTQAKALQRFG